MQLLIHFLLDKNKYKSRNALRRNLFEFSARSLDHKHSPAVQFGTVMNIYRKYFFEGEEDFLTHHSEK